MTKLDISLPDPVREFVDEKVSKGEYPSASEYICQLIIDDQNRGTAERLERLLLEGLESGDPVEANSEWWEQKQARLIAQLIEDA